MNPEKTAKVLKLLKSTVPLNQQRAGWMVSSCPLAPWTHDGGIDKNPAFGVKKMDGVPFSHCFACGWNGSLHDLVLEMRQKNKLAPEIDVKWGDAFAILEEAEQESVLNLDSPDIEELLFGPRTKPHVFPDWWLASFPVWKEIGLARDYLQERGIAPEVADFLDIRADTYQKRVCFPVRDFKHRLMGFHGRAVEAGIDPRYRMYLQGGKNNPHIWLGEQWVDFDKPIVVVEGPMDLASVLRVYPNTVSPLFANPSAAKIKRMADALEWITFLDRGKGGDAGREKMAKALKKDHVIHHIEPPPGRKDPGVCTVEELKDLLSPLVPLG